ncbi:MAG: hypothetical protein HN742_08415 [Lentisphaerae bacterium]|nr:hypothetical protein [Lentisphaerota bacterium]MBT4818180.1 hypothetical protein [Lentisphaerota bacterium]MBT5610369.1 hypothetical protein [Lentisphaerota bacterium]MBT7056197.1 hypothetical protein [Lentisphaerota bacterium]MBT7841881.1 hypothetical protein [Lentisphaerota bacterium]
MTDSVTQPTVHTGFPRRWPGVLRLVCAWAMTCVGVWGAPGVPKPSAGSAFDESVVELLGLLRERRLLPPDDAGLRRDVLEAIMEAVNCHGALVGSGNSESPAQGKREGLSSPVDVHTVGGLFAYALVPTVSTQTAGELSGVIDDIGHGHYEGVVLDMRFAGGGELAAAEQVAGQLAKGSLPIVVLINGETVGAAEVLASQARARCNALMVGQPTRGLPYQRISERLSSGDVVLLPKVEGQPEGEESARSPIQPDVVIEQTLARETLIRRLAEQLPSDDEGDLCLRRAIDLLTTIHALKQKRF